MIMTKMDRMSADREIGRLDAVLAGVAAQFREQCGMSDEQIEIGLGPMRAERSRIATAIATFDAVGNGVMPPIGALADFGTALVALRRALGESQRGFAERLGISQAQLSKYERAGWGTISLSRLSDVYARLPVTVTASILLAGRDGPTADEAVPPDGTEALG